MARTDRTPRDETAAASERQGFFPQPRQDSEDIAADQDGGPIGVSEDDQAIAADMLREYGPAFRRLADL
ncbi:hypothetical protein [Pseudonocardia sp. HH130629-09]|nr:hypothetical protein [Pseudonocardia sp. HH130629-09]